MNCPDTSALSVKQFCTRHNLSPATAYRLMEFGDLPYRKVGRRRLIGVADAEAWWNSLPHSPGCAPPVQADQQSEPPSQPSPPIQPKLADDTAKPHRKPGRLRVARCHACGRDLISHKGADNE